MEDLDRASLDLSIALLDHEIRGDLFESRIVALMAALGMDHKNQTYHEPSGYTVDVRQWTGRVLIRSTDNKGDRGTETTLPKLLNK